MSPEQTRGEHVDHRSDLFSLGCVLYAMCTGRPPFRGDSLAAVIKRVADDTPRPIEELNPEVPPWLVAVIQRLLEKQPDQRFQSAKEVAEAIGGQMAHLPPVAPQAEVSPRASRSAATADRPTPTPVVVTRSRSERLLIWLVILLLTMFLLVPGCLLGVSLLVPACPVPGTRPRRLTEQTLRPDNGRSKPTMQRLKPDSGRSKPTRRPTSHRVRNCNRLQSLKVRPTRSSPRIRCKSRNLHRKQRAVQQQQEQIPPEPRLFCLPASAGRSTLISLWRTRSRAACS